MKKISFVVAIFIIASVCATSVISQQTRKISKMEIMNRFQIQAHNIMAEEYYEGSGFSEEEFSNLLKALSNNVEKFMDNLDDKLEIGNQSIPILIVIPPTLISYHKQLSYITDAASAMPRSSSQWSLLNLRPMYPDDGFLPYVMIDVDCSNIYTKSHRPDSAEYFFNKEGRSGLSAEEIISLLTHNEDELLKVRNGKKILVATKSVCIPKNSRENVDDIDADVVIFENLYEKGSNSVIMSTHYYKHPHEQYTILSCKHRLVHYFPDQGRYK